MKRETRPSYFCRESIIAFRSHEKLLTFEKITSNDLSGPNRKDFISTKTGFSRAIRMVDRICASRLQVHVIVIDTEARQTNSLYELYLNIK